jgi:hypothetical protein
MPDEDVTAAEVLDDGVTVAFERRDLVLPLSVAREVYGERLVA